MFGPLPEDPAEDQPASWASLADRLGVADLLEPQGRPLSGHSPCQRHSERRRAWSGSGGGCLHRRGHASATGVGASGVGSGDFDR